VGIPIRGEVTGHENELGYSLQIGNALVGNKPSCARTQDQNFRQSLVARQPAVSDGGHLSKLRIALRTETPVCPCLDLTRNTIDQAI
jgi:hypothetical protein